MQTKSLIKAIGYDVDGVMVDSEPLHVMAWHETLHEHGHDFAELPADFRGSMAGRKPNAIASFMVGSLIIPTSPQEFLAQKHAKFMDKARTNLRPMPGAVESIKRFGKLYVLGIGTSLNQEYIDFVLDILGVADHFSAIVTGDDIKHGKPAPDTFLTLAERLAIDPKEMVVLEDAKSGIQSAKSAGCWCIAIENVNAVAQNTTKADRVVRSLDEVTVSLIHELI